ncbi:hypothetical protein YASMINEVIRUS_35 [Yasminevirus sp. GU-2018]|uniref:RING-type domain-containing protein n=1 Tax=Yasminevirus sp. GU-2018 TaxID=2420051 RepID=A0A5K0U8C7_9VIRU|nr:hypothetical protein YASMINEVIRUS_35 [Yasminevirus sp. GU-2018]
MSGQNTDETKQKGKLDEYTEEPPLRDDSVDKVECPCCLDEVLLSGIVVCSGDVENNVHYICESCLRRSIMAVLNQKTPVWCGMCRGKNKGRFPDDNIKRVLNEDEYKKYLDSKVIEENLSIAKVLSDYFMCPFCSKYGVIIENVDGLTDADLGIHCPLCDKNWCAKCRNVSHVPSPCGKLTTDDPDVVRKMVEYVIDESAIKRCPKCLTKFDKEDGCNLIKCDSCKSSSCHTCSVEIQEKNGTFYWHFAGREGAPPDAKCQLWYASGTDDVIKKGNKDYIFKMTVSSLNKLATTNADNAKVLVALYTEIVKRGYGEAVTEFKSFVEGYIKVNSEKEADHVTSSGSAQTSQPKKTNERKSDRLSSKKKKNDCILM